MVVGTDFLHVHFRLACVVVLLQQVERGELIVQEWLTRIDGRRQLLDRKRLTIGLGIFLSYLNRKSCRTTVGLYRWHLFGFCCRPLTSRWQLNNNRVLIFVRKLRGIYHARSHIYGILRFQVATRLAILLLGVRDSELNLRREVFHRIQRFTDDLDGFCAQIGEEGKGHNEQDGRESRRTNDILQLLHTEQAVVAAGIENLVAHHRREELGKRYRAPNHDQCQAEEPLPEVHLVDAHQSQSHQNDEDGNQESRQSKVHRDERVGKNSSDGTAIICKLSVRVEPFARSEVFQDTLVGLTGGEIRNHGDGYIHRQTNENDS